MKAPQFGSFLDTVQKLPAREADLYAQVRLKLLQRDPHPFALLYPDEDNTELLNPNGTPKYYARHKYAKHLEFFRAGADYRERCLMAGNRCGKSICGGFEVTSHLTGLYRSWWEGRRFGEAVRVWVAGKSSTTTRDIIQYMLLGNIRHEGSRKRVDGTGLIPEHLIGDITWKQGVPDAIDTVRVKHTSGGWSTLGFKSYEQGRGSFEGTSQHVIWLDEEPPIEVYGEALIRTATVDGIVMLTFTPLEGYNETVKQFMPSEDGATDIAPNN